MYKIFKVQSYLYGPIKTNDILYDQLVQKILENVSIYFSWFTVLWSVCMCGDYDRSARPENIFIQTFLKFSKNFIDLEAIWKHF